MKKLWFLLLLPLTVQAATISSLDYSASLKAVQNVVIASGTWTDPADATHTEPVLFVKFTADHGMFGIWHTCAITRINEFLAVAGDRTLAAAVTAKTPNGYKVDWNDSYKPAPANIHPWCLI